MIRGRASLGLALGVAGAVACLLAAGSGVPAIAAAPAVDATVQVACGDGPVFPLAALDGPQGAELDADPAAQRLARAATTGEVGYLPRGGWMRVLDRPDLVVMATWLHLPRSVGGPLLQATLTPDAPGATTADAWHIRSAGFCWPHVVAPEGSAPVAWTLGAPVDPTASIVSIVPSVSCDGAAPVVVRTPERVSITAFASEEGSVCDPQPSPAPVTVPLGEPLGARELLDGITDPPTPIQAAAAVAATAPPGPHIAVSAIAHPTAVAGSQAIADALGAVPGLVPVTVVDTLTLELTVEADVDLVLAGPPRLCLVGPFSAPDDAGLIDRCWGDPDPGAALAPVLPRDAAGDPLLPGGVPVTLQAAIQRGAVRCDYPPGAWHLEVVLTPLIDGHGWTDVALPDVPLTVDATGLVAGRELGRLESRYCGMAVRPSGEGSPTP